MSETNEPRRSRVGAAVIVAVLVVVIAAVAIIGVLSAGRAAPATPATSIPPTVATESSAPTPSPSSSVPPLKTATPKPAATASKPQATRTASISEPTQVPIVKAFTAGVTKIEAVQGKAGAPGEIAGPAVRFTISIKNTTGKSIDLSNTVVNAYYGSASTPAIELASPGGVDFPRTVADGSTAKGVFVFNIPENQRGKVEVTVDTSVKNPVVAFKGSAPR